MKTTQELQAEIYELKAKIAQLEFDKTIRPNADWQPNSLSGPHIELYPTLENIW